MDTVLVAMAVIIGLAIAILFWSLPLKTQLKALAIALLLSLLMIGVLLSFSQSGTSFIEALTNPPSWKLLALASTSCGLVIAIIGRALLSSRLARHR